MAIKLNELEPTKTRWQAPSDEYPQGKFINGTGKGKKDGSYAKAEWANEIFGFFGALLKNGKVTPNGLVETAKNSQIFQALKAIIKSDIETLGGDPSAIASGSADAITATFNKPVVLENGKRVLVRATAKNATATPTFTPSGLATKKIVKGDNLPLSVGDISGAGFWAELVYDASYGAWILQNPATGVTLVLPDASESTKGIAQIASDSDMANGTDNSKIVTPKKFKSFGLLQSAQTLSDTVKNQVLTNLGVFTALETLIREYGGSVPAQANEASVQKHEEPSAGDDFSIYK